MKKKWYALSLVERILIVIINILFSFQIIFYLFSADWLMSLFIRVNYVFLAAYFFYKTNYLIKDKKNASKEQVERTIV